MPYVIDEGCIKTKLFGVSIKSESVGRQQLLIILRNNPLAFTKIWVEDNCICIIYDKQSYVLGRIREEYSSLLNSHTCEVIEMTVTGGYQIEGAGVANLGCNVVIKLTTIEKEKKVTLRRPHEHARIELLDNKTR